MKYNIFHIVNKIKDAASKPSFCHSDWYLKYHLEIVLSLAQEFSIYENVKFTYIIELLVWMHDFGKIFNCNKEYDKYLFFLIENDVDIKIANQIVNWITEIDAKCNLNKSAIEVQIVSSADAVSHLISPFYMFYWKENAHICTENILKENRRKLEIDWQKKITLNSVKEIYFPFYESLKYQFNIGNKHNV